jgi:ferredoxin
MARLRVDGTRCDGHGLCAELLPEAIGVDDWGYPIVADRDLARALLPAARRAVVSCPLKALSLVETPKAARRS